MNIGEVLQRLGSQRIDGVIAFLGTRRGSRFMPNEMAVHLGLGFDEALNISMALAREGLLEREWYVYHCEEYPVALRKFSEGFQPVPWECIECGNEITTRSELTYELTFLVPSALEVS